MQARRCVDRGVWCGQRLMSPRQSRARVCHFDSIRYRSPRVSRVSSPSCLSLPRLIIYYELFPWIKRISPEERVFTRRDRLVNSFIDDAIHSTILD